MEPSGSVLKSLQYAQFKIALTKTEKLIMRSHISKQLEYACPLCTGCSEFTKSIELLGF